MHLGTQTVSLSSYQMIIPPGKHSRIGFVDIGYQFVDIGNQVITVFPNGIDTCLARRSVNNRISLHEHKRDYRP